MSIDEEQSHLKVSVILSVFNSSEFLNEAIQSILNQTFNNFEFIIVNDGSTDETVEVLKNISDPRVIVLNNECNFGLAYSLNKALAFSKGEYVVRMDADDVALPDRLVKQIDFMNRNPDISVSGTWVQLLGDREGTVVKYPSDSDSLHCYSLFACPFAHPSVIIRRCHFEKMNLRYNELTSRGQDYELWMRALLAGAKFANLTDVLLKYRIHPKQSATKFKQSQRETAKSVHLNLLKAMKLNPSAEDIEQHESIAFLEGFELNLADVWICKIYEANLKVGLFSDSHLRTLLLNKIKQLHYYSPGVSPILQVFKSRAIKIDKLIYFQLLKTHFIKFWL